MGNELWTSRDLEEESRMMQQRVVDDFTCLESSVHDDRVEDGAGARAGWSGAEMSISRRHRAGEETTACRSVGVFPISND